MVADKIIDTDNTKNTAPDKKLNTAADNVINADNRQDIEARK